jgi:hypothetical protein
VSWIPSPIIDHVTGRKRKWAEDEDIKLRDAIQMYGSKSWDEVAALAPGIVRRQFWLRWHRALDPISIDQVIGHVGTWAAVEEIKLKDELGYNCHTGSGSSEKAVLVQME